MEVKRRINYNLEKSISRIDEILNIKRPFKVQRQIPKRTNLTYNNGYYVNCYAIFIDIRNSSLLPKFYKRPKLALIYRSYISELVAILNSYDSCQEINIVGDSVSGIFEAANKTQIKEIYSASCKLNSLINILNYKLFQKKIEPIKIGIGIAKGRALMIQAGFKGSKINDVVWMGEVVNQASNLCNKANKDTLKSVVISESVYNDFLCYPLHTKRKYSSSFKKVLKSKSPNQKIYHGNIKDKEIETYLKKHLANK